MKRITIILCLTLLSIELFSQDIRYIKLTDTRWETMTNDVYMSPKKQKAFNIALQVYNDLTEPNPDNRLRYFMILSFKNYSDNPKIPTGGKLLIKTGKDEIISSVNDATGYITVYSPSIGRIDVLSCYEPFYSQYFSGYIVRGRYELTTEDLTKIIKDGVIRMRVETNEDMYDITFPLEEPIKIGKEKKRLNRFGIEVSKLLNSIVNVFDPLKNF